MEILGKLFGSEAKTKIVRLFLFNPKACYTVSELSARADVTSVQATGVLAVLIYIGLIRKKFKTREAISAKKARSKSKKIRDAVYFLDQKFPYISVLSDLMAEASVKADNRLIAKLMPAGKIKLIIAGGIFTRQDGSRLDLLVAGDDISENKLGSIMKSIETEIGRELLYSCLATSDFQYRLGLHDRLIRDVIDFPHIVLLDRIGFRSRKGQ